ncbi:MAG TPA: hypothetical protein VHZ50_14160, partial [Puia sp.]|nr:hypothetical protein [Puia sp.]
MRNGLFEIDQEKLNEILGSREATIKKTGISINNRHISVEMRFPIYGRDPNIMRADLIFRSCTFEKSVLVPNGRDAGNLLFDNCVFENDTEITSLINVHFINECSFKTTLTISGADESNEISNFDVEGCLKINAKTDKLILKNINQNAKTFGQKIIFDYLPFFLSLESVTAMTLTFQSSGELNRSSSLNNLKLTTLIFDSHCTNCSFALRNSTINEIKVNKIIGDKNSLSIVGKSVGILKLPLSPFKRIDISDCDIQELELSELNDEENILNIEKTSVT